MAKTLIFTIILYLMVQQHECSHLCNYGTWRQCICYRDFNLHLKEFDPDNPECRDYIADESIEVVQVKAKSIENLLRLSHNIATFFNNYCMENTNNCAGTELPIKEERVVILEITTTFDLMMEIKFVVTRSSATHTLRKEYILSYNELIRIIYNNFMEFKDTIGATRIPNIQKFTMYTTNIFGMATNQTGKTTTTTVQTRNSGSTTRNKNQAIIIICLYTIFLF
jgi:hypothetical protein